MGTGPYRLGQWRRSSQVVLERNPNYREAVHESEPAADDVEGQAIRALMQGRRLPLVDRVEVNIIESGQPLWLAFLGGELDQVEVPPEFAAQAMPGGGGVERQIRTPYGGQAIVAHSAIGAHLSGFDPAFRSESGQHSPSRARALLDIYKFADRDGDGWREQHDGTPLTLVMATMGSPHLRARDELIQRDMKAIGLRIVFLTAQFPEQLKAARAAKLMMFTLGYGAVTPDGQVSLARLHGPAVGGLNLSRFRLPAMDALYERLLALPDGSERLQAFDQAKRLAAAYLPK